MLNKQMWSIALKAPETSKIITLSEKTPSWKNVSNIDSWTRDMFTKRSWTHFICYNDDPPNKKVNSYYAHSKGVLVWDNDVLGWLIHSCPNWPECPNPICPLPPSALRFAQSFIFLELPVLLLNSVLCQLRIMNVNIYNKHTDLWVQSINCHRIQEKQLFIDEDILHFAKSASWKKDLFDDFLFPKFGGGYVETWMRPTQPDSNNMDNLSVIKWEDGTEYTETEDHSKYAFSTNCNNPWVYIGDVNHIKSQSHRGGGGVIIKDKLVWSAFFSLISKT